MKKNELLSSYTYNIATILNYLKGVTIKDLAMQLDQNEELIKMVIRNKGIAIVDNSKPETYRYRYRRKRRK